MEGLLAERGISVSYEAIRRWCWKFGPNYARRLKKKQGRLGDTWYAGRIFSSDLTASSSIFGLPWIRMVMSSIFCCGLAAINVQPSGSLAVKASNHSGSPPTSKSYAAARRTILRGSPMILNNVPTIAPRFRSSPLGSDNDKCVDSNLLGKLNAFCRSTVSSGVFLFHDIC